MTKYCTQMAAARAGVITPELERCAEYEGITAEELRRQVAEGQAVIPANKNHKCHGVTARLEAAKRRVDAWLSGEIRSIPELEDPRLPYDPSLTGDDALTTHNLWETLVTTSNMCGV